MATAQEMIRTTGLELSLIGIGEDFESDEEGDLLDRLRQLLDSFTLKGWVWPSKGYEIVSFTPSAAGKRFTLGLAADSRDITAARVPLRLSAVVDPSGRPLIQTDLISLLKEGVSDDVTHFFYELVSADAEPRNYGTAQYGRIHFNRDVKTTETYELFFQQPLMVGDAIDATDELLLPFGYERFVMFNFAAELLNSYGIGGEVAIRVERTAAELMNDVMELNKDLYAAYMANMVKTSLPGTDATVEANAPVVSQPINRTPGR